MSYNLKHFRGVRDTAQWWHVYWAWIQFPAPKGKKKTENLHSSALFIQQKVIRIN